MNIPPMQVMAVSTYADLLDAPKDNGSVYCVVSTGTIYTWIDNDFIEISPLSEEINLDSPRIKITHCPSCGAPVDPILRTCPYCDVPYILE